MWPWNKFVDWAWGYLITPPPSRHDINLDKIHHYLIKLWLVDEEGEKECLAAAETAQSGLTESFKKPLSLHRVRARFI